MIADDPSGRREGRGDDWARGAIGAVARGLRPLVGAAALVILVSCGSDRSFFERGMSAFDEGAYSVARREWTKGAARGDARSQNGLGRLAEDGLLGRANVREAVRWYTRAAAADHAGALLSLGNLYDDGLGVEQNYFLAARYFGRAAELGNAEAQNNLGRMLKAGQGGPLDERAAARWLKRSADQGFGPAQNSLGLMLFHGQGMNSDVEEAAFWLSLAVRHGVTGAVHNRDFVLSFLDPARRDVVADRAARWRAEPQASEPAE